METQIRALIIEDAPEHAELLVRELKQSGLDVVAIRVEREADLEQALSNFVPHVILSDYNMADFGGGRALEIAVARCPDVPFIFVAWPIGEERTIEALRHGAVDYVLKGNIGGLAPAVRRALQEAAKNKARRKVQRELEASERRLRLFMRHLPGAAYIKDLQGRLTFANHGMERIAGKPAAEIVGRLSHEVLPGVHADEHRARDLAAVESSEAVTAVEKVPMADGLHFFLTQRFPILDDAGKPTLLGAIATDITERVQQEEKIQRLSRIHALLSGINSAIVRVRTREELFREACRIAVESGGFRTAWIGLTAPGTVDVRPVAWMDSDNGYSYKMTLASSNVAEDHGVTALALRDKQCIVVDDVATDPRIAAKSPERGYRSLAALPLLVDDQAIGALVLYAAEAGFFGQDELKLLHELGRDLSFALDRIMKNERFSSFAYYDTLTGLANRELFFDRLTQLLSMANTRPYRLCVLVFDVQRFSHINDSLGRSVGDKLLQGFADRLRQTFGESPTLGRISGDRFAVIVDDLRDTTTASLIERWTTQGLAQPFVIDGAKLRVTCKIGIAISPSDGHDAETLLSNAEAALQRAKDTTDLFAFYSPEMSAHVVQRLRFESRLREAVVKKQFTLHYQPKVDLRTRHVEGLEALIRWRDPDRGLVSPHEFVPLLEETGMIIDVGRWVIEQVVADMRKWQAAKLRVPRVAVNVSQIQVRQMDFVHVVLTALGSEGDRATGVDLEITESLIMVDTEASLDKLRFLRARGLQIFMDDFGTGYSSLSQIAALPLDALKIDRAFISRMEEGADAMAIVSAMIRLAQALRISVVAEGVETERQESLLAGLGCDQAQGFLFGRPMTEQSIVGRLDRVAA
jgi:diguanylate cyclase (GGDEF)-like protein/PAS domain S-box-containing protein